jgi:hypothetical protein
MTTAEATLITLSRLKHSWLENQLLNKDSDDIVRIWRKGNWPALDHEFSSRIAEALRLADALCEVYSPGRLVQSLAPFSFLKAATRLELAAALHQQFLERSGMVQLSEDLKQTLVNLEGQLDVLRCLWPAARSEMAASRISKAWEEIHESSSRVYVYFASLPMGVWLP